ncbi:hypothetical protein E6W39_06375 [Kitasatospora acidiphila]|uniref:Uncharacterized protein n=1 Tax=Kitasatospora acidiphila TaxID=2567942 RepID=A0A540VZ11_9ACTN|nr:hypothetical protein [Kitasatospora acidiphila]TQF01967.1 hypothetical protein E6W39_06375 [Kitasatospora acidiphila]
MYDRSPEWLLEHRGMESASTVSALADYRPVAAGMAFATNQEFQGPQSGGSLVIGGACLSGCAARLDRLRLEFVADTVHPLLLAACAGTPCVLYLPIAEEAIVSGPSIGLPAWQSFGDRLEVFVNALADAIPDGQRPILIRTDAPEVSTHLETAADQVSVLLDQREMEELYTIVPARAQRPGTARLRQYRRSIVSYLPSVVAALTGYADVQHVVVAENFHQVRAIDAARRLLPALAPSARLDHLAHLPSPSVSGTSRMARASERSVIFCGEAPEAQAEKVRRMPAAVRCFWERVWPPPSDARGGPDGQDLVAALLERARALLRDADRSYASSANSAPFDDRLESFEGTTPS